MFDKLNDISQYINLFQVIGYSNLKDKIKIVLDVGSGIGTTEFSSLNMHYEAIDIDNESLEKLSKKLKELDYKVDFNIYNSSFIDYDFGERKYDLIIMNYFLNVIPYSEIQKNLEKAFNLLNERCLISVRVNTDFKSEISKTRSDPNVKEIATLKFYDPTKDAKEAFYNYFSKNEMEKYLREAKFQVEQCFLEESHSYCENKLESYFNFIASKMTYKKVCLK